MKKKWNSYGLYPILDYDYCLKKEIDIFQLLRIWLSCPDYVECIQVRAKSLSERKYTHLFNEIQTSFPDALFIINDYWKLYKKFPAYGIHLGKEDYLGLSESEKEEFAEINLIKGTSSHSVEDLKQIDGNLWTYTGFGPMFSTETKKSDYETLGLRALLTASEFSPVPLVPIGGITLSSFPEIYKAVRCRPASISLYSHIPSFRKIISFLKSQDTAIKSEFL